MNRILSAIYIVQGVHLRERNPYRPFFFLPRPFFLPPPPPPAPPAPPLPPPMPFAALSSAAFASASTPTSAFGSVVLGYHIHCY
jgi:hypothetical protein